MNLDTVLSLYGFSLLILLIILLSSFKIIDRTNRQDRLFLNLLFATMLMIVFDGISRLRDISTIYLVGPITSIATFLVFALHHLIVLSWILYLDSHLMFSIKRTRIMRFFALGVFSLQVIGTFLNLKYHFFYEIDASFTYQRGPLYFLLTIGTFVILLLAYLFLFLNIKQVERKYVLPLLLFAAPPIIGTLIQSIFPGMSLMLPGVVLGILLLYLRIQTQSIYTDYLTGINNRKRFDRYLSEKISYAQVNKTFSGVMLDVDSFKNINDTYGHDLGDTILREATDVLKSSIRQNDFIARFGGDEICLILDISNEDDLKKAIHRIHEKVSNYNLENKHEFKLRFSMGYAVYDPITKLKSEEFIKLLDDNMYLDKKNKTVSKKEGNL